MKKLAAALALMLAGAFGGAILATAGSAGAVPNGQYVFEVKDPVTGAVLRSTVTRSITTEGKVNVCEHRSLVKPGYTSDFISYTCYTSSAFSTQPVPTRSLPVR